MIKAIVMELRMPTYVYELKSCRLHVLKEFYYLFARAVNVQVTAPFFGAINKSLSFLAHSSER